MAANAADVRKAILYAHALASAAHDVFLEAFVQFSKQVSNDLIVAYGLPIPGLTYGIEVAADYKAFNLKITEKICIF